MMMMINVVNTAIKEEGSLNSKQLKIAKNIKVP